MVRCRPLPCRRDFVRSVSDKGRVLGVATTAHLQMLEWDSTWGRFVDSIPGRINDESLVFGPIIFVDTFQSMVVPIVQAKLSS